MPAAWTSFAYCRRRTTSWLVRRFASPERQLLHSIANVRGDLAALGFPIADVSDDELIAGLRRASEALRAATPTAADWVAFGERWRAACASVDDLRRGEP